MPDLNENVKDQDQIVEQSVDENIIDELIEQHELENKHKTKKEKKTKKSIISISNIRVNIPIAVRVAFLISITFLVVYIITVISDSNGFTNTFSQRSALELFDQSYEQCELNSEEYYNDLYKLTDDIFYDENGEPRNISAQTEIGNLLKDSMNKGIIGAKTLYYTSKGNIYYLHDTKPMQDIDETNYVYLKSFINAKDRACSQVFMDNEATGSEKQYSIAMFVPVKGSEYVDGIIAVYYAINTDLVNLSKITNNALLIDSQTGKVINHTIDAEFQKKFNTKECSELGLFIEAISSDNFACGEILRELDNSDKYLYTLDTYKGNYVITSAPLKEFDNKLSLITIHNSDDLIVTEMQYIRHVLNISIISIVALGCGIIYALLYYKKTQLALSLATTLDPVVGCPNADAFRQEANKLIHRTPTKYAIAVIELKQYTYLTTKLPESNLTILLGDVGSILQRFCGELETYGYLGEGKFALLMHETKEQEIINRCRLIEAFTSKNPIIGKLKYKRKLNIGICMTYESKRMSVQEVINNATIACDKARSSVDALYYIYNKEQNVGRIKQNRLEEEMQGALEMGDFKLFLQPKLHIAKDQIDSAEALVRWFDPKKGEYRFPGEFIGLFESNGFIVQLDHYMYLETLKYVSQAVAKGEKVVPISVNVSQLTINSPDFLTFYLEQKKNYHVGDGYITLEFTESFSMEDFERINEIVKQLHDNGIKCSLDDFGTGYSTLGVLKNIPFDELKFDRLFLQPGLNKTVDLTMLKSLIELAKTLNIKVVQEGVENREMYDRCTQLGVDVIQGFYYAKPIPVEEYRIFINSNTSIKYKSLVK